MDFDFAEEQRLLMESARAFARHGLAPGAVDWDHDHRPPVEVIRTATEQGYLSPYIAEEDGGLGLLRLSTLPILEQLTTGCMATTACISIHSMAAWMLASFGDAALKETWLPDLIGDGLLTSYYLIEPGAGFDVARLRTRARREGDKYVLSGSKCFISGAGSTQVLIVMACTGGGGTRSVSCFLVPVDAPGIRYGRSEDRMGWRAQPVRTIAFEDVHIPAGSCIGPEGQSSVCTMKGLDGGRLDIASCSLSAAQAALEQSMRYVEERRQLGKPLTTFQALQFKLAGMLTEPAANRQMVRLGARRLNHGDAEATLYRAVAKCLVIDHRFDVCSEALQLYGGCGYLNDYPLGCWVRDTHVHQILEGTGGTMQMIVVRRLLEQGGMLDRLLWTPRTIAFDSARMPRPMIQ